MKNDIRLVCFDLNKTLISENTWYDLNLAMGISEEEDKAMLDSYIRGEKSYLFWQKEIEKMYIERGKAKREDILKVIYTYRYLEGAKAIAQYLKEQGYILALISGSIDLLVKRVAGELGIEHYYANNQFIFDKNNYLSEIVCLGDDWVVKKDQLIALSKKTGVALNQIACVGDGDNDMGIFALTGRGITFKDSKIRDKAWKVIDKLSDLKSVL
ncbi:MAG: HAD-IB family phosphatase [Microgenomates group bacterium]